MSPNPRKDWPPALLGWLLDRHLQDQQVRIGAQVARWTLDPAGTRLLVTDEEGRRLATVQFSVVWDPTAPGPQQGRELAMHFDVVGFNAVSDEPLPDARIRQDVEHRIARLGRWLGAVERRLETSLEELFPRDAAGLIEWERSPLLAAGSAQRTAEAGYIKLGNIGCGLRCMFCTRSLQAERTHIPAMYYANQLYEAALAIGWADPGADPAPEVTVGGDEPLYHPDLRSLLRLIRQRGFRPVLQSSAPDLLDTERIRTLCDDGLTQVHLPLYGATAAVHDAVVDKPGHFDALVRATGRLRTLEVPTRMHSVVLVHNRAELPALLELVEELTGTGCGLLYPRDEGASRVPLGELLVRLSELPVEARRVLNFNVPCLGVGRPAADPDLATREMVGKRSRAAVDSMQHHFGERCTGCVWQPQCHGLPAGYLERFGEDELEPA